MQVQVIYGIERWDMKDKSPLGRVSASKTFMVRHHQLLAHLAHLFQQQTIPRPEAAHAPTPIP